MYSAGVGYKTLAALLENYPKIGHFPININISRLDLGDGIAHTLMAQQAQWHKSCRLKFSQTKLERAKKRKASEDIGKSHSSLKKYTRGSNGATPRNKSTCFFCDQDDKSEKVCCAGTLELDKRVR